MASNFKARISTDKFGQKYQVVGCKDKKGTGFPKGYVELGGKLYRLEPSNSNKDGVEMWIRVTAVKKQTDGGTM
ncbi:hypothetical protein [Flavobacterium sp. RSSB_23]|uniref:hypothetical protein n=1 Tax=Flavobacterium sp. RSSB_23 TaxID=3447668 RepID=UPI003F2D4FBA